MPSLLVQCQSQKGWSPSPSGKPECFQALSKHARAPHLSPQDSDLDVSTGSEGFYCKMFYFSMRRNWNIFTFFLSDVLKVHLFGWECCGLVARSEEWHEKLQDGEDLVLFDVSSLGANYFPFPQTSQSHIKASECMPYLHIWHIFRTMWTRHDMTLVVTYVEILFVFAGQNRSFTPSLCRSVLDIGLMGDGTV